MTRCPVCRQPVDADGHELGERWPGETAGLAHPWCCPHCSPDWRSNWTKETTE